MCVCVCSLMGYNPHAYAEGAASLGCRVRKRAHTKDVPCPKNAILQENESQGEKVLTNQAQVGSHPYATTTKEGSREGEQQGGGRTTQKEGVSAVPFNTGPHRLRMQQTIQARSVPFGALHALPYTSTHMAVHRRRKQGGSTARVGGKGRRRRRKQTPLHSRPLHSSHTPSARQASLPHSVQSHVQRANVRTRIVYQHAVFAS